MSFCTGRVRKHGSLIRFPLESRFDVPIWSRTDRTRLSFETNTSTTSAIFHSLRAAFSSHRRTTSFTQMFRRSIAHFCRLLMESIYSCLQRVQKMFAKYCTRRQRFLKIQILSYEISWGRHHNSRLLSQKVVWREGLTRRIRKIYMRKRTTVDN